LQRFPGARLEPSREINVNNLYPYATPKRIAAACVIAAAAIIGTRAQAPAAADATPPPPPPPKWDLSLGLGLTLTEGNTDSLLFSLIGRGDKKWDVHELHLGADLTYGETEDVKNSETARAFGQYNRLFTERWYGYARAEALHDDIADVDYRFTIGPGVGYYIIKQAQTSLSVEGGPAFVYEKQGGNSTGYFTLRIAERFEHKFNERARIWQTLEFLPQVDELDNYIINAEVGVESALTQSWALSVILQDTYDNQPAEGRQENDLKLISAVKWKY
jgi:putative salt-induced outer membrane protein YdiY